MATPPKFPAGLAWWRESAERPKFLSVAMHAYLSGMPHRIGHVERAFEDMLSRPGVACWNGAKILDWHLGQTAAR